MDHPTLTGVTRATGQIGGRVARRLAGDGPVAAVARDDITDVAVNVLLSGDHVVSDAVANIAGHPPSTLVDYLERHPAAYKHLGAQ